jgi:hypothetical protein
MYEMGFALDNDLKTVKNYLWYPADVAGAIPGAQTAVVRKGTETIYEIAVPWTTFKVDAANVKEGMQIGVSSAFNFKDENAATLQYQVGGSLFTKIPADSIPATLVAAPAVVEEAPVEEAAADSNPDTADASAIMYVLAALSTLGGSVILGKRK